MKKLLPLLLLCGSVHAQTLLLGTGGTCTAAPCKVTLGTNLSFTGSTLNASAGAGGVTSVAFADASTSPIYTISGSPVTTTGTLTETLSVESANAIFAGPTSGGSAQPTFRSLTAADLAILTSAPPAIGTTTPAAGSFTTLAASTPIAVASGGTGAATLTGIVVGNGTGAFGVDTTTGSGTVVALATSPVFVTPTLGAATATSINGNTFTTGTYTLTGTAAKTLTFNNSLTLAGTDTTTMTFPATTGTVDVLNNAQTFTAAKTFTNSDLLLLGSSTGATTFTSANAGASNYTMTVPAVTDTLATLGAAQTWTAQQTFQGGSINVTTSGGYVAVNANGEFAWVSGDAIASLSTGDIQIGGYANANPTNQTISTQNSRNGTDNNKAGANLTIASGLGTGSSTGSILALQTPHTTTGGTAQQTATTQISLGDNTVAMPNIASSSAATTGTVCWTTSTGNLTVDTTLACLSSTKRVKQNIQPLDAGLDEVMKLRPVSYDLRPKLNPKGLGPMVGLVAEETQKVDPRLVGLDPDGKPLGVRYMQLTAVLIKAIQEQQHEIIDLKRQLHRRH